ncbi:MAG TPA: phage holin family protein [Sphingobacteriaceae bacterium]
MMKELETYIHYIVQVPLSVKKSLQSTPGIITMIVGMEIGLSGIQKGLIALLLVFHLDLITGCIASWIEHKNSKTQTKVYFFESSKLRLSVVKAVSYIMLILCSWLLGVLFFDMPISLYHSTKTFTPAELTTGVCIAIEIWSNIENVKRAGFDVVGKFTNVVKQVWNIRNTIKSGNE